jgi:hypothetical protein
MLAFEIVGAILLTLMLFPLIGEAPLAGDRNPED